MRRTFRTLLLATASTLFGCGVGALDYRDPHAGTKFLAPDGTPSGEQWWDDGIQEVAGLEWVYRGGLGEWPTGVVQGADWIEWTTGVARIIAPSTGALVRERSRSPRFHQVAAIEGHATVFAGKGDGVPMMSRLIGDKVVDEAKLQWLPDVVSVADGDAYAYTLLNEKDGALQRVGRDGSTWTRSVALTQPTGPYSGVTVGYSAALSDTVTVLGGSSTNPFRYGETHYDSVGAWVQGIGRTAGGEARWLLSGGDRTSLVGLWARVGQFEAAVCMLPDATLVWGDTTISASTAPDPPYCTLAILRGDATGTPLTAVKLAELYGSVKVIPAGDDYIVAVTDYEGGCYRPTVVRFDAVGRQLNTVQSVPRSCEELAMEAAVMGMQMTADGALLLSGGVYDGDRVKAPFLMKVRLD